MYNHVCKVFAAVLTVSSTCMCRKNVGTGTQKQALSHQPATQQMCEAVKRKIGAVYCSAFHSILADLV